MLDGMLILPRRLNCARGISAHALGVWGTIWRLLFLRVPNTTPNFEKYPCQSAALSLTNGTTGCQLSPTMTSETFHVHKLHEHTTWSKTHKPVVTCCSGSTVRFSCLEASNEQIGPKSTVEDLRRFDFSRADQVYGPIYVQDASPGDVLDIEVLETVPGNWAWTAIVPGFGLLQSEFGEHALKIWKLPVDAGYAEFNKDIKIPIRPFTGCIGLAPAEPEHHPTIPPMLHTGGNIDTRYVNKGSRLFLPVEVDGALLSVGDGHAAQGDGEVCGTAIETNLDVTIRVTVRKDMHWVRAPSIQSVWSQKDANAASKGTYSTMGVDPDLMEAARKAVRSMIEWLMHTKELGREDAYMLCSVAADMKIVQCVNQPNWGVGCFLPLDIFSKRLLDLQ